jgi:hypothetical protein
VEAPFAGRLFTGKLGATCPMLRSHTTEARHAWTFFRTGGLDQVAIETAEDILALPTLDQKLWVALSCPVDGMELDERTLSLIDVDHDGHIHAREVLHALEWAAARLKHPADLLKGEEVLALSAINDADPEDRILVSSAREVLRRLGKKDAEVVTPDDFTDPAAIFPSTTLNGDGVLAPSETDDAEIQALIKDIIACVGGEKDRSGADGVTAEKAGDFFAQVKTYLDWVAKSASKDIAVLGERTAAACAALTAVRAKIDDYFARCQLASFDARAIGALNRQEAEYLAIAAKDLQVTSEEIAGFPLARVDAHRALPLLDGVNPAWAAALATFHRDAVAPVFGPEKRTLTQDEWKALQARLAPYDTWLGGKVGTSIEQLGVDRAKAIIDGPAKTKLEQLFAADRRLQPECEAIASVERLVRYHRDLRTVLHNFVNFADFYSRDRWAVFQAGKLYLDSRACELCIRVEDPGAHARLAIMSKAYIAYVDCRREKELVKIAACFTQGDSDYLFVGRNGLFYDRHGRDWHATITKIIENPISLREAFWTPYKKVIRAVEEQVAKRAAAADTSNVAKATAAASPLTAPPPPPGPAAPPPPAIAAPPAAKKLDLSSIIGLSVALGSVGTFLATVVTKFVDVPVWKVGLVIIAIMFAISLPSVFITWLKLRQRNLGPILEANGWAINGRVKINIPFGTALTERARLPAGSRHRLIDPYGSQHPVRSRVIGYSTLLVLLALALWLARHERTWPFGPLPDARGELSQLLNKRVSAKPPAPTGATSPPATPTPATPKK